VIFRGYGWWITVILDFKIGGYRTIRDYDGFKLRCSVLLERRLGLGSADAQQESPNHFSYGKENSLKSYVNQGDH